MPSNSASQRAPEIEQAALDLLAEVLRTHGEARIRVGGTSMLPAIRPADILIVRSAPLARAVPGDVVLFTWERRLFAHRVVQARTGAAGPVLITRGDRHSHCDLPVQEHALLGFVSEVVRNGARVRVAGGTTPFGGLGAAWWQARTAALRIGRAARRRLSLTIRERAPSRS